MKNLRIPSMGLLLLLSLAWLGSASAPAAEPRIATIDLKKVFDDYYKTKLADASIKDEATGLEKDMKALTDEHDKAVEDYKKTLEEANNQSVSAEEREKRKKDAEGKLIKVNDLRQTIEQFNRTARNNLDEKLRQTRDKIVAEIKTVVSNAAKTKNYTLVLDISTSEPGGRPSVVIYTSGDDDLTPLVITQLNANAPANLPLGDKKERKDDKPEKKK